MLDEYQISRIEDHIESEGFHYWLEEYAHNYFEENPEWDPLFIAYDKAVGDIEAFLKKQGVSV